MSSMRYYLLLMAGNILVKYIICTSLNPEGKKKKNTKNSACYVKCCLYSSTDEV